MTIPFRGDTGHGTYFVTSSTWMKKRLLQSYRSAELLIELMYQYRAGKKFLLHEFVVIPDHFHLLLTPLRSTTLEQAVGMIKGAFSYRASRTSGTCAESRCTSEDLPRTSRGRHLRQLQRRRRKSRNGLVDTIAGYPSQSSVALRSRAFLEFIRLLHSHY